MTGIIGAMEEEIAALAVLLTDVQTKEIAAQQFICGRFAQEPVVLAVCGIGKVNAAVCVQILVSEFNADRIINTGIAGALADGIAPGDMVIGEDCVEHDMDVTALGDSLGQVPRMDTFAFPCDPALVTAALNAAVAVADSGTSAAAENGAENGWTCYSGRIVSGDQFIANREKSIQLRETFGAAACEMEGAAIAHAAYLNKVPCVIIRSISDNASTGAAVNYAMFKPVAISHELSVVQRLLSTLSAAGSAAVNAGE